MTTDLSPWYDARDRLVSDLHADLIGGPDDVRLDERPLDRFVAGILHPSSDALMDEEDVEDTDGASSGAPDASFDPAVALSRMRYPSSFGLTFAVDADTTRSVTVDVDAARYVENADGWARQAVDVRAEVIDTTAARVGPRTLVEGLDLYVVVRTPDSRGLTSVTVVLLNTQPMPSTGPRDPACWFQPSIRLSTPRGRFSARRPQRPGGIDDADLDSYDLLFRRVEDLAVGHGCAATWDHDADVVTEISSTFLPQFDLKLAEPRGGSGIPLPMSEFAKSSSQPVLMSLVESYRDWVDLRRGELDEIPLENRETAERHLSEASAAADRMARGIELLTPGTDAARAFELMNEAMHLQRSRQDQRSGKPPSEQYWRPFQMAFILLNLEGLTDPDSDDREIADLLWFPTGGGKTEAYLGLIGYTILLRRLRNPNDGGVSVIMRYTLRLLTVQQFERAAGLICALETIRAREIPGAVGVSLGLWVGQAATPNKVDDARKALKAIANGDSSKYGNPVQLLRCPVCGTALGAQDYKYRQAPDRIVVTCANSKCEFAGGLPVHLVDEDVYRVRPSLVIGTVDKFAMMAWRAEVGHLFGRDGTNSQPDLIVQDELHLISGPLGTMVGLYETAVDAASTGAHRPKVVASTATIRRAEQQVRAVFAREARQFPPSGLDAADSYFAVEATAQEKGTRRYVGVVAPSASHTTLMVRTYAALLQGAAELDAVDSVRDAYWTLVGYFNSLRVLGGAYMQTLDDVPDRLKVLASRHGSTPRSTDNIGELTSRVESERIPRELGELERSLPDRDAKDVVLATNMISVGVDVDRLGLMAVMGQPQTTAEYIQSTSRVGRRHPGLVVVIYNAARSRDLSHFENFASYHAALYRQVEATGATPFAARARDRGLHGLLVSMTRLMVADLRGDERAVHMSSYQDEVQELAGRIVERCLAVAPQEVAHVRAQLDLLIGSWAEACDAPKLKYAGWFQAEHSLLHEAAEVLKSDTGSFPVEDAPWPTMTSLRDVDATSHLYLVPPTPFPSKKA
jgi:hypothetical protein